MTASPNEYVLNITLQVIETRTFKSQRLCCCSRDHATREYTFQLCVPLLSPNFYIVTAVKAAQNPPNGRKENVSVVLATESCWNHSF